MSLYVVDASVVIKWFIPEKLTAEALRIHSGGTPLHAPAFLDIEVANIAWKKIRRGEITRPNADFILAQRLVLPLTRHPDAVLLTAAFDIADRTGRTVYDSLYIALAVHLGPAQRRLRTAAHARGTRLGRGIGFSTSGRTGCLARFAALHRRG